MISHANEKKEFQFPVGATSLALIKTNFDQCLAQPTIIPQKLGGDFDQHVDEDRHQDAWITFFEQANKHPLEAKEIHKMSWVLDSNQKTAFTPSMEKEGAPQGSQSLAVQIRVLFPKCEGQVLMIDELGVPDNPSLVLSNLSK
jgi:hypothetical protein